MNKNETNIQSANASGGRIETPYSRAIPKPTSGPIVTALGAAFLGASMVTDYWVLAV